MLSLTQLVTLKEIINNPNITTSELWSRVNVYKPGVYLYPILTHLERKGYIKIDRLPPRNRFSITKLGQNDYEASLKEMKTIYNYLNKNEKQKMDARSTTSVNRRGLRSPNARS